MLEWFGREDINIFLIVVKQEINWSVQHKIGVCGTLFYQQVNDSFRFFISKENGLEGLVIPVT